MNLKENLVWVFGIVWLSFLGIASIFNHAVFLIFAIALLASIVSFKMWKPGISEDTKKQLLLLSIFGGWPGTVLGLQTDSPIVPDSEFNGSLLLFSLLNVLLTISLINGSLFLFSLLNVFLIIYLVATL